MTRVARLSMMVAILIANAAAPARADESQSVSFSEAVSIALSHHPAAAIARAGVQAADAQRRQVRSAALPTLAGNAVYTQLDSDRTLNERVLQAQAALGANVS